MAPHTGGALAALNASMLAASKEPAHLSLEPAELAVPPGSRFQVVLGLDSDRAVSHLPLELSFDPEVLELESVRAGDHLGAEGEAAVLSDIGDDGRLTLGASRLGSRPGVTGRGVVAVLTFRALSEGESEITFDRVLLRNRDMAELPAAAAGATVRVDPAAAPQGPAHTPQRPGGAQPHHQKPE